MEPDSADESLQSSEDSENKPLAELIPPEGNANNCSSTTTSSSSESDSASWLNKQDLKKKHIHQFIIHHSTVYIACTTLYTDTVTIPILFFRIPHTQESEVDETADVQAKALVVSCWPTDSD